MIVKFAKLLIKDVLHQLNCHICLSQNPYSTKAMQKRNIPIFSHLNLLPLNSNSILFIFSSYIYYGQHVSQIWLKYTEQILLYCVHNIFFSFLTFTFDLKIKIHLTVWSLPCSQGYSHTCLLWPWPPTLIWFIFSSCLTCPSSLMKTHIIFYSLSCSHTILV